MTTIMQTTTQTVPQATTAVTPQHPLTAYELKELLNIAMGERGGGTGGNPPGPPGGGGLPGGGGPATAGATPLQPIAAAANVKAMGKDPPLFQGKRKKAGTFINEVKKYLTLNYDVVGFNFLKKKVALVLTFMQGPEVEEWTRGILQWIQQVDNQSNMEDIWRVFLRWFYARFTDTQADFTARKDLTQLKMRFPDIDTYITDFKQTVRKALYRLGSHEMNQQFLSGLPRDVAKDVMCYPMPITYQEYTQKALASVRSKVLLRNVFRGNRNFRAFAPQQQCPQWNNPHPQGQNVPQYNLSNAPWQMNNTLVPMNIDWNRAPNCGQGNYCSQGNYCGNNFCGQQNPNHYQGNCPFQGNATTTGNPSNTCFQCGEVGHFARNCPKHRQSNQYNWTANLINFNDGQNYTDANIVEEDPVEALQTQLNSLSTQDREKLAIAMGGGDQQDFPSA